MKHRLSFWVIASAVTLFGLVIAAALVVAVRPALAQGGEDEAARYGAAIYAEFCQACHGPRGEAIAEGPAFQAITFDPEAARQIIAEGRDSDPDDGAAMPAYAQSAGGPLNEARLDQLLAYMATWETGDVPPLPAPNLSPTVAEVPDYFGDVERGATLYATSCYGCHGAEGRGRVPPRFPGFEYEADTFRQIVSAGVGGPTMPGFGAEAGGPLSESDLDDLETYVASWDVEEPQENPSPEGWSTFLVIIGVLSVLAVGGYYGGGFSFSGGPGGEESGSAGEAAPEDSTAAGDEP